MKPLDYTLALPSTVVELRVGPLPRYPRHLSEGLINSLDGQLASNVIDTCGHATANGRVGNCF